MTLQSHMEFWSHDEGPQIKKNKTIIFFISYLIAHHLKYPVVSSQGFIVLNKGARCMIEIQNNWCVCSLNKSTSQRRSSELLYSHPQTPIGLSRLSSCSLGNVVINRVGYILWSPIHCQRTSVLVSVCVCIATHTPFPALHKCFSLIFPFSACTRRAFILRGRLADVLVSGAFVQKQNR